MIQEAICAIPKFPGNCTVAQKARQSKHFGFRPVSHTADAAFKLWGETVADIFVQGPRPCTV